MAATPDEILPLLPSYVARRCLFIERPTMSLADVESASIDGDVFRAAFSAPTDGQVVCEIDDNYRFAANPGNPYGDRWEVSLNLSDFYFDPDYWDGSRFMGWRVLFDSDVIRRFVARDLSWMEDWF